MTGKDWPPLVPYRPGEEEKLPEILPDLPPTVGAKRLKASEDEAKNRAIRLEAASLTSAYHQLEKHGLRPVPDGSKHLCKDSPKMKVTQGDIDWDLMKVAVTGSKDSLKDGINKEDEPLDFDRDRPPIPSTDNDIQPYVQKRVTMVKKKGKKKTTPAKKRQLENRSIFCGPIKKKKKPKKKMLTKAKVEEKDGKGADVSSWRKRKSKKKPAMKVPQTLDLSAEVISHIPTLSTLA